MNVAKPLKFHTLEEFEKLSREDGWNYELIDGVVMMSPRPAIQHQIISGNLYAELRNALRQKNCIPIQEIDLILDGQNFVPDLMVICNESIGELKNYKKPPLIAIEIISPGSSSRDHITKRRKYEQLGIQEYWIISPEEKCVTVLSFATDGEEMYCEGQVKSSVLPEVVIDLGTIFE